LFQINDTGAVMRVAWPTMPGNAWLVLDRDGDGLITHGGELFGNTTRMHDGEIAAHGDEALQELDTNQDRLISEADPAFRDLRLWVDHNRNGISERPEMSKLREVGIVSLSVEAIPSSAWTDTAKRRPQLLLRRLSNDTHPRRGSYVLGHG
jgi:hypothetical protein